MIAKIALVLFCARAALGYSKGAPEAVCDTMKPSHGVDPQKSEFPYTISVDKDTISASDKVKISISGGKPFQGFLLQVRDGETPVGAFHIDSGDRYSQAINCAEKKQNAATHKNAAAKKSVDLEWVPPTGDKKTYTIYATVAETAAIFWVRKPTATITVN